MEMREVVKCDNSTLGHEDRGRAVWAPNARKDCIPDCRASYASGRAMKADAFEQERT
jgi:hypothetical protein